ncbi:MAG: NAD-dependent deacylase [Armatimonadetes bacterium]|nr:NAD-dependent deacylase [Armatimonadota bacterium]
MSAAHLKIIVFTGAGISRESGLSTFRDSKDGLWEGYDVAEVASVQGWQRDPAKVLDFYNMRRREVIRAEPNAAHLALATLEKDHDVTIITQNIDDLHERAGSSRVIHLHGEILKVRAYEDLEERTIPWRDDLVLGDLHPDSKLQLRPHIVWFGEGLPEFDRAMAVATASDVEVLIVVGTTLNVYPAAYIATETQASQIFVVDPAPPSLPLPNVRLFAEAATLGVQKVINELATISELDG